MWAFSAGKVKQPGIYPSYIESSRNGSISRCEPEEDALRIIPITSSDYGRHIQAIKGMHRLRGRVFKDRLEWDVSVTGGMEIDTYDALSPIYLVEEATNGSIIGTVRFLPTTGPTMLGHTFPALLDGQDMPCHSTIFESSRFCVDTEGAAEAGKVGLRKATHGLLAGMIEWSMLRGIASIVTVTNTRMERILRRAGWSLARIGAPRQIGSTEAVAGYLSITEEALWNVRERGGLRGPVLFQTPREAAAA